MGYGALIFSWYRSSCNIAFQVNITKVFESEKIPLAFYISLILASYNFPLKTALYLRENYGLDSSF
jgi:hypothetical protein